MMSKRELVETITVLTAVIGGTAVSKGIRNACGKDAIGTIGGLIAGAVTSIAVVNLAENLGVLDTTEEVKEPEKEDEEA